MLRAFLYNIQRNELQPIEREALRASMPAAHENARKSVDGDPSAHRDGRAHCHENEFAWVDLTAPDEADFQSLRERFQLHETVLDNLREKSTRPKIHDYGEYSFIVFYAINWNAAPTDERRDDFDLVEIDCLVGSDFVVTIHEAPLQPFDDLCRRWTAHPQMMRTGPAQLLYELMDEVLDDYFPALDALDARIDGIEDRLFDSERDDEKTFTAEVFALKRDLLQIRHIAGPTRDVANVLLRRDAENGGKHFVYFQDLYDHASRIVEMTDTFRDVLSGALDAFLAVESNRMNAVMKTLTSASIILLVPNLIAAIYGMNFANMPETRLHNGYFYALGFMAAIVAALYVNFKRIGWL